MEVDPRSIDFGLIEYGQTVEEIVKIKNLSPIVAKCQVKQANKVTDQAIDEI